MKNILFLLITLLPSFTIAKNFNSFESFDNNKKYAEGSYVKYSNNLWVARHKIIGKYPEEESLTWAKVKLNNINEWKSKKVYLLGQSISYNKKTYFAKSLRPIAINSSYADYKWVEFYHPAMGFNLPDFAPEHPGHNTIEGVDQNENGIRDDYEIKILMSNKPKDIKELALKAGKSYQTVLSMKDVANSITQEEATNILLALTLTELCKRQINKNNASAIAWKKSDYFNTIDRVEANFSVQNKLASLVDEEQLESFLEQPCASL
jgi:hypothetical protein